MVAVGVEGVISLIAEAGLGVAVGMIGSGVREGRGVCVGWMTGDGRSRERKNRPINAIPNTTRSRGPP
jgi:hypothetical protein